jgi:hypothetical protein
MQITNEELIITGKLVNSEIIHIDDKEIIVTGNFIKTAKIKEEWDVDVDKPDMIINELVCNNVKADIFTFMQRLPYSKPQFKYYMEWDNVAAIPITTYDTWFKKQLHENPRKKIRKAQKLGTIVRISNLDDELINGIKDIYNETHIRQGRPYWNYGMDFELTKKENSQFLDRATFIGAYYQNELIGFIRIVCTERFARTMGILGKVVHRDKAPMNLLLAKAVEVCEENKMPYLVYAKFDYGKLGNDTLQDFKYYNGFESIALPRYFIPLTIKGKIVLFLNLHHGIIGIIPKKIVHILRSLKHRWHKRKNDADRPEGQSKQYNHFTGA